MAFGAGLAIDGPDALAVGGEGEADGEFGGVLFGLGDAFGKGAGPGFGFDDGEFLVAEVENEVSDFGRGAAIGAFFTALGDAVFAEDLGAGRYSPAGGAEGGFDVLGSGLGFVHWGRLGPIRTLALPDITMRRI